MKYLICLIYTFSEIQRPRISEIMYVFSSANYLVLFVCPPVSPYLIILHLTALLVGCSTCYSGQPFFQYFPKWSVKKGAFIAFLNAFQNVRRREKKRGLDCHLLSLYILDDNQGFQVNARCFAMVVNQLMLKCSFNIVTTHLKKCR